MVPAFRVLIAKSDEASFSAPLESVASDDVSENFRCLQKGQKGNLEKL